MTEREKDPVGRKLGWALGLLLAAATTLHAERLPIKTYTTADGLGRNRINEIVRDSRGFLWFCTPEGLSRFDGYKFTNYTTDDGLPHRSVRDLLETRSGTYWLATGAGLVRFNPTGFRHAPKRMTGREGTGTWKKGHGKASEPMFTVYHPGNASARSITALYEDRTRTVWVGTWAGLYRLEEIGNQAKFHFVEMGMPRKTVDDSMVETIAEDRQGALWIGTRGSGLYRRWPDGRAARYTTRHGLPGNRVHAVLQDREGRLWVGTEAGLCRIVPEPDPNRPVVIRVYTKEDFRLPYHWINTLFQSSDGRLWVGLSRGLSEFTPTAKQDGLQFRSYTTAHGLSDDEVGALAEDRDLNLWIGTSSGGAMKMARHGLTMFGKGYGLADTLLASVLESGAGELCALTKDSTDRLLINRFDGKGFVGIRLNFPKHITYFGWGWTQFGLQDRVGDWWLPTGQGLCRFPKVRRVEDLAHTPPKAIYTTRDGLIADDVFRLFEDSRGDIWIASWSLVKSGIVRWERATDTFCRYSEADGLPPPPWAAEAFCEDRSGRLWIGIGGEALARYRDGRFTLFTAADGLPTGTIRALYLDHAGRLWIATGEGGLSRIDDPNADRPRFVTFTTAEGLSSNEVWCITEDGWGRLYVGTGRGLDRLEPATGQIKHYTTADGLSGGQLITAFRDRHGALWFGTTLGLSRLIPRADTPRQPPPILLSGLRIAGDLYPVSDLGETEVSELRLGPSQNQLQIDFFGLSFASGEALRYQYKLEGADSDWSAPTDQRTVSYASLSPGTYSFAVRAVNADGMTSPTPASVTFIILPPVWRRWWFLSLTALLIGLAVYGWGRYRLSRAVELEQVRTRIAADLHDDIGSSLSRMAILSEVVKRQSASMHQEAVHTLSNIAETARGLVDTMSDIVWAIDPARDDLGNLLSRVREFASEMLESKGIRWDFQAPPEPGKIKLTPDQRRHLFLILKEAITNVARHSGCRAASLQIAVQDHALTADIRDDGQGFVAPVAASAPGEESRGHGLRTMRTRAAALAGRLEIKSSPGAGTHLSLKIPLKKRGA